jgi:gamma-glutamyltranspeptidase/glutathione hydrolase
MVVEGRLPLEVIRGLEARGHEVEVTGDYVNGKTMAIRLDQERGVIMGGVAPKGIIGYALGW